MKIESIGFRITGICEAVPMIEVEGAGSVRLRFKASGAATLDPADFAALREAINVTHERMEESGWLNPPAKLLKDRSGDIWTLRPDGGYTLCDHDPTACAGDCLSGPREWVDRNWGPAVELADEGDAA